MHLQNNNKLVKARGFKAERKKKSVSFLIVSFLTKAKSDTI